MLETYVKKDDLVALFKLLNSMVNAPEEANEIFQKLFDSLPSVTFDLDFGRK